MKNEARPNSAPEVGQARPVGRRTPLAAFLIALPMMFLTFMMLSGRHRPCGRGATPWP